MKEINRYIDICLIDEYADKSRYGYSLDIESLPQTERDNFLDLLMQNDTEIKDIVLSHMQKLIDERLPERESENRSSSGMKLIRMQNGDTQIMRSSW